MYFISNTHAPYARLKNLIVHAIFSKSRDRVPRLRGATKLPLKW